VRCGCRAFRLVASACCCPSVTGVDPRSLRSHLPGSTRGLLSSVDALRLRRFYWGFRTDLRANADRDGPFRAQSSSFFQVVTGSEAALLAALSAALFDRDTLAGHFGRSTRFAVWSGLCRHCDRASSRRLGLAAASLRLPKNCIPLRRRVRLERWEHMRIRVQRQADLPMPERLLIVRGSPAWASRSVAAVCSAEPSSAVSNIIVAYS
jgi:hypothetical protein